MPPRLRIGLTGGIASGKSTVEQRFTELGVAVINADDSARAVVARGSPGLAAVVERFGAGILTPQGELDRRELRSLIFGDAARRKELEAILHPLIPLLVEGNSRGRWDRVLVVDADESLQLARLMSRDAVSEAEARATLAAQASRAARLAAADDVLVNSGTVAELRQAVDLLHRRYLELAADRPP
jgi:dephospho-CoA kinase